MPIEIKELYIRVSVTPPAGGTPAGAPGPAVGAEGDARKALVEECIEQVLQVLHDRKER